MVYRGDGRRGQVVARAVGDHAATRRDEPACTHLSGLVICIGKF